MAGLYVLDIDIFEKAFRVVDIVGQLPLRMYDVVIAAGSAGYNPALFLATGDTIAIICRL